MPGRIFLILLLNNVIITLSQAQSGQPDVVSKIVPIADGWAKNSINAVIFRRNALVSFKNHQFAAFYAADSTVALARRQIDATTWDVKKTRYRGNAKDAHNAISIMVDGDGYLHMSWDHHGNPLNYCRSKSPAALELTAKLSMTGKKEANITYPEFYRLPDGNPIFLYRDGASGRGNLAINYYDTAKKNGSKLHDCLIDGEGQRNAYWQMAVGADGSLHSPPDPLDRPTAQSAGCLGQRLIGAIPGKNLKASIRSSCCKAKTLVILPRSVSSVQICNIRVFRVPLFKKSTYTD